MKTPVKTVKLPRRRRQLQQHDPTKLPPAYLWLACVHEAAHAVVGRYLRLRVVRCTQTACFVAMPGHLKYRAYSKTKGQDNWQQREVFEALRVRNQLTMLAAGELAVLHDGGMSGTGSADHRESVRFLKSIGVPAKLRRKCISDAMSRAARLVVRMGPTIYFVAGMLAVVGEISGGDVDAAIRYTRHRWVSPAKLKEQVERTPSARTVLRSAAPAS